MTVMEPRPCPGRTKTGRPCRRKVSDGHELCPIHEGQARRPTALTDTAVARIVRLILDGVPKRDAVPLAGMAEASFWRWMETGEADTVHGRQTVHARLWEAVTRATAQWKADQLALIHAAATGETPGQWQAAAWLLERRYPQEFSRRTAVALDGGEKPVRVETLPDLAPGDREARDLAHRLLDRQARRPD